MKNRYENRMIRIFISSTFEDMKAERDYLITKVFPILAAKAAERDVTLIPLDLRWGISEEESRSGKVVEICLKEIEQSRPFFIGLLGNRYGWCPPVEELEKNALLKERYGWIEDDIAHGLSVTEMEIQYGVLRNPDEINAYFYIREKDGNNLDESQRETEYRQKTDNASEGNAKLDKLKKLKDSVRNNGRYPVTDYRSVEELGKKVEEAFNILLDSIYPDRRLSNLERERLSQSAFLHSRCDVYIPQSEALMRLTRFMQNTNERYLVVAGKSGIGKSSLIANWLLSAITAGTDKPVTACPPQDWSCNYKIIYHFLGNGNAESDFHIIADRLCNEIRDIYGIKENESDKPNETAGLEQQQVRSSSVYMKELESLFSKISGKERLLIVLDGINQLSGDGISENAKLLLWLPPAPANVKYLFTTLPDDCTMDVFKRRGYPVTELSPMKKGEREELIVRYLKRYGKKLTTEQVNRILSAEQCENTHVLRTLLDELVNFGSYELLDKRIDHYLESGSPEIFFLKVIRRFEEDYGKEFTERILSLIAFSRSGLSEQEILSISGIAAYRWSQFYCAFRFHLIVKSGLLTFSQKYMQDAVVSAYKGNGTKSRRDIIRFFLNSESVRAYDELPYQMYILNDAEALYNMLLKPAVTDNIFKKDKHELGRYWRYLIETDDRRFPPEAYLHMHTDEAATVGCFMEMAYIFSKEIIKIRLAKRFIEKIMSIYKNSGGNDSDTLAIFYRFAGDVYSAEGDYIARIWYLT